MLHPFVWVISKHLLTIYPPSKTGVAGAAWSVSDSRPPINEAQTKLTRHAEQSIEAFQTVPAPTNDAEASSYRSALFSLNDLLPSEVRSFYSSLGNAQSSIRSKYNVPFPTAPPSTTTTSTAAAKTGGADKLANAMGVAAIGLGAVAVLL